MLMLAFLPGPAGYLAAIFGLLAAKPDRSPERVSHVEVPRGTGGKGARAHREGAALLLPPPFLPF